MDCEELRRVMIFKILFLSPPLNMGEPSNYFEQQIIAKAMLWHFLGPGFKRLAVLQPVS